MLTGSNSSQSKKRSIDQTESVDPTQLFKDLLGLKDKADELWLHARDLEDQEYEIDDIEESYQNAYEKYVEVQDRLNAWEELLDQPIADLPPFEIVHTFYLYKTLADAHFDMNEYGEAEELYQRAYELYQQKPALFQNELTPRNVTALLYNRALAKFHLVKEGFVPAQNITTCIDIFCDELLSDRAEKKTGYQINRLVENLLESKQLLGSQKVVLENELARKKLFWLIAFVLTKEQIVNFVTQPSEGANNLEQIIAKIHPPLSVAQTQQLNGFTVPKRKVEEILTRITARLADFNQSAEFSKLKLMPHQIRGFNNFHAHLAKGRNKGFFVSPTGSGKTRMFISEVLASGEKAIILVPSIALVEQTKNSLMEQLAELGIKRKVGVCAEGQYEKGDIVIMTNNSLHSQMRLPPKRRRIRLEEYPIVVVDEAHLSLTQKAKELIDELAEDKLIIGCTATEEYNTVRRKGALISLSEMFGEENCFFRYPAEEAIKDKVLSPVQVCYVTTDVSFSRKRNRNKKTNKNLTVEITEKEIAEKINQDKVNMTVPEIYENAVNPNTKEKIFGKQATAFCAGIEHAKAVADTFNDYFKNDPYFKENKIIPAAHISGEMTGKEQKKILADFRKGKIALLCGSDLLITGIDHPDIEVEFNLRPTFSKVMAMQRFGRCTRRSRKFPNKSAIVFEYLWVEGQVTVPDFFDGKHQVGEIPPVTESHAKWSVLNSTQVTHRKAGSAQWELNWTGQKRPFTVKSQNRSATMQARSQAHMVNSPILSAGSPVRTYIPAYAATSSAPPIQHGYSSYSPGVAPIKSAPVSAPPIQNGYPSYSTGVAPIRSATISPSMGPSHNTLPMTYLPPPVLHGSIPVMSYPHANQAPLGQTTLPASISLPDTKPYVSAPVLLDTFEDQMGIYSGDSDNFTIPEPAVAQAIFDDIFKDDPLFQDFNNPLLFNDPYLGGSYPDINTLGADETIAPDKKKDLWPDL